MPKTAAESGELVLDSPAGIRRGGSRGALLVPGKPDESLLLRAVKYADTELQMPPQGKLPPAAVAVLARWVELDAPLPDASEAAATVQSAVDLEAGRQFWSFQPLRSTPFPAVGQTDWPQTPIDGLLLARLESVGPFAQPARPIAAR